MSSENDSKSSWVGFFMWLAAIAVLGFTGGGGIIVAKSFIAFGEMKNEVSRQGDSLASVDKKLGSIDQKISNVENSQTRLEATVGALDKFVRFALDNSKSQNSANLDEEGSAESVPAGMSM